MRTLVKFMAFSIYEEDCEDVVTNEINIFLKEEKITPDQLIDIKTSAMGNSNELAVLIIYKEY